MVTSEELTLWLEKQDFQKKLNRLVKELEGKRVMIYGAGMFSHVVFDNYNVSNLNIIGVSDIKFLTGIGDVKFSPEIFEFRGYEGVDPFLIPEYEPDIILISSLKWQKLQIFLRKSVTSRMNKKCKIVPLIDYPKNRLQKFFYRVVGKV